MRRKRRNDSRGEGRRERKREERGEGREKQRKTHPRIQRDRKT